MTLVSVDLEDSDSPTPTSAEAYGDRMTDHRRLVHTAIVEAGGQEVDVRGAHILAVFLRVRDAVDAAAAIQRADYSRASADGARAGARVALHTGEPIVADGRYLGLDVHRVLKLCEASHGGQILLSQTVESLLRDAELPGELVDLGEVELQGLPRPERVFQLSVTGLRAAFPELTAPPARPAPRKPADSGRDALRVVLAEDTVLLREGLAVLLENHGCEIVGHASNPDELMLKVRSYRPDVAIVDLRMPPTHTDEGLRASLEIRSHYPEVGVLVLSQYVEPAYAVELVADNAAGVGYLLKDRISDVAEFVSAVRRVANGGTAFDPKVVSELVGRRNREGVLDVLSPASAKCSR